MNSVYDAGLDFDLKYIEDISAVVPGDNKMKNCIEVESNKIFKIGETTSTDYEQYAAATGFVVLMDFSLFMQKDDYLTFELLESDTTIATDFLPVDPRQISISSMQDGVSLDNTLTSIEDGEFTNNLSIFVKYNGFKKYVSLNLKGGTRLGVGGAKLMYYSSGLGMRVNGIHWYPVNN